MANETPRSERLHIGFFGRRNAGKSSLLNAVTAQELAVVADFKGTTTDPVYKSMEILPLGSVTVIDTPGYDDKGELGEKRVKKTKQVLNKTDIAVLVCDAGDSFGECEKELKALFAEKNIPYIIAYNKADVIKERKKLEENEIYVSAKTGENIYELKEMISRAKPNESGKTRIIGDFIKSGDIIVLVTPIDAAAPKARLILPQQQTIRDVLDSDAVCVVAKETELEKTLEALSGKIKLVVCDSQVFGFVNRVLPKEIPLTSFSILFARYKGILSAALDGIKRLETLSDGDTVLISEGCTHHRQCGDIGTEKLPNWIREYTKKELNFEFTSGGGFPEDLKKYALIVHCGGCMLPEREILHRQQFAKEQNIPITNYGILIAKINGILKRSTEILEK